MITSNIDVSDGLVNGAYGILEAITFVNNKIFLIWLKFKDEKVGKIQKGKYKNSKHHIPNCVPLEKARFEIFKTDSSGKNSKFTRAIREQFLIVMCESMTIYKGQGQTFDAICLDVTGICNKTALIFVGLSRSDFNNVYITGTLMMPVKNPNKQNKKKEIKTTKENEDDILDENLPEAVREINRMRKEQLLKIPFEDLENYKDPNFSIIYQNINGYASKIEFVIADTYYHQAEIMIFSETNTGTVNDYPASHKVVYPKPEDKIKSRKSRGVIILSKSNSTVEHLERNILTDDVELYSFIINDHYVITGYRSPNSSVNNFVSILQDFVINAPKNLFITIIGDFNLESGIRERKFQKTVIENLDFPSEYDHSKSFRNLLCPMDITTNRGTQIDVVFSSSPKSGGGTYFSYFSDHYAVYFVSEKIEIIEEKTDEIHVIEPTNKPLNQKKPLEKNSERHEINNSKIENEQKESQKDEENNSNKIQNSFQYALFENKIIAITPTDNTTEMAFTKMSAFNATAQGFISLIKNDINFKNFLKVQTQSEYFQFLLNSVNYTCQKKLYQDWINLICKKNSEVLVDTENIEKGSLTEEVMFGDSMIILENFLKNEFATALKHQKCKKCNIWVKSPSIPLIKCSNVNISNERLLVNAICNEYLTNKKTVTFCDSCEMTLMTDKNKNNIKYSYNDILIIGIINSKPVSRPDLIAPIINISKFDYELKIIVNNTMEHYNTLVKINNKFTLIDDDNEGKGRIERQFTFNPKTKNNKTSGINAKILVYYKKLTQKPTDKNDMAKHKQEKTIDPKLVSIIKSFQISNTIENILNEPCEDMNEEYETINNFINLSGLNSIAHSFLNAMHSNSSFKTFISEEIERNQKAKSGFGPKWRERMLTINTNTIFKVLFNILNSNNSKAIINDWKNFISVKAYAQIEGSSRIFDLSFKIHELFIAENFRPFLGDFVSFKMNANFKNSNKIWEFQQDCIFLVDDVKICKSLSQNIFKSIDKKISQNQNFSHVEKPSINFNKLILIIITDENHENENILLDVIPSELILPSYTNPRANYRLLFIINSIISEDENTENFFTSISNMPSNCFIEINEKNSPTLINSCEKVNPKMLAYFDNSLQEKSKKFYFSNKFSALIVINSVENVNFEVHNMCCFNSFVNAILKTLETNNNCLDYIFKNSNKIKFLKLMEDLIKVEEPLKNSLYLQYLHDNDEIIASKIETDGNMEYKPEDVLIALLGKRAENEYAYCQINIECHKCFKKTIFKSFHSIVMLLSKQTMQELQVKIETKVKDLIDKKSKCNYCDNNNEIESKVFINKFFFILINRMHENYEINGNDFNVNKGNELNFNDIPKVLNLFNKDFKLLFIQNFCPYVHHYTSLCHIQSNDSYCEIDDLSLPPRFNSNLNFDVNPKLLVYMSDVNLIDTKNLFEYALFTNDITAKLSKDKKDVIFSNLCAFNASAQGFIASIKTDLNFKKFVESQTKSTYFQFLLNAINNNNQEKMYQEWIDLICEKNSDVFLDEENVKDSTETKKYMHGDNNSVLYNFFENEYASALKQRKCHECNNLLTPHCMSLINCYNTVLSDKKDLEKNIKESVEHFTNEDAATDCDNCKISCNGTIGNFDYNAIIILAINNSDTISRPDLIAPILNINNSNYELKFIVNNPIGHYNTLVKVKNDYILIDDLSKGKERTERKFTFQNTEKIMKQKTNASTLVYFRNRVKN